MFIFVDMSFKSALQCCFSVLVLLPTTIVRAQTWSVELSAGKYMLPSSDGYDIKGKYTMQLGANREFTVSKAKELFVLGGIKYQNRLETHFSEKVYQVNLNTVKYENTLRYMLNYITVPVQVKKYFKVFGIRSFATVGANFQYFFSGVVFTKYYDPYKLLVENRVELYHEEELSNSVSLGPMASIGIEHGKFQYSITGMSNVYSGQSGSTNSILLNAAYLIPKKPKKDDQ